MSVTVRFAPSPTGRIHAGNIRTAMFNHLFARRAGGRLIFRLDDTDRERSTEEFARGIEEDLHWLGVDWADKVRQSDRFDRYAEAVEKLKASGRLYPAYETPEELELKRKRQLARGKPPVYDRAALAAHRGGSGAARSRRAQAALAVQARAARRGVGRPRARAAACRCRFPVRPGAGPRRRDISLYDAERRRRHRSRNHPCDSRRGSRHEHRAADPAVRSAGRRASGLRSSQSPGRRRRRRRCPSATARSSIAALREEGIEALAVASYSALIGTSDPVAPHAESRRAGAGVRLRQAVARAGAVRSARAAPPECEAPAHAAVQRRGGAACGHGRWRRGRVLGGGTRQSRRARRGRALVAGGRRTDRAGDREPRALPRGLRPAASRALGRGDLAGMVFGRQAGDRRQGQGSVRAASSRAHRRASMDPSSKFCCR